MNRTAAFVAASIVSLSTASLAACAGGLDNPTSQAPSIPATTSAATPSEKPEGWEFCDELVPGMQEYADYILATGDGNFDANTHSGQATHARDLRAAVPKAVSVLLDDYLSPHDQIASVVQAGGGNLTLENQPFKDAVLPLMTFCNGVGYKVDSE